MFVNYFYGDYFCTHITHMFPNDFIVILRSPIVINLNVHNYSPHNTHTMETYFHLWFVRIIFNSYHDHLYKRYTLIYQAETNGSNAIKIKTIATEKIKEITLKTANIVRLYITLLFIFFRNFCSFVVMKSEKITIPINKEIA